ncbi:MAG: hypothetical protein ACXAD7_12455 [Candidatus Kariarchaeaceae archaeon]|jgi:hypothetical protein
MSSTDEYSIDNIHATLSNTSVELAYLFWEVPRATQTGKTQHHEWCPLEILIHLRQVAEVFANRIKRLLKNDNEELPLLHDFDEKKQMAKIKLYDESVRSNLSDFMKARSNLLNQISFIDREDWHKKIAQHETQGEVSLYNLLIPLAKREVKYLVILKKIFDTTV